MARFHTREGLGLQGWLLAFVTTAGVFSVVWLTGNPYRVSPSERRRHPGTDSLERLLDRYGQVAKNMSTRIHTAEQVLRQLQRERARPGLEPPELPKMPEAQQPAVDKSGDWGSAESEDSADDSGDKVKLLAEQMELIGYSPGNKTYRRWRPDFQCGDRVPLLPDNEMVECDPLGEMPCCSSLGWCGKSPQHCSCGICTDYRAGASISVTGTRLVAGERECEEIAHNFGEVASPAECAKLLADDKEHCGRAFMFPRSYPSWGCRCCAPGTAAAKDPKPAWDVYEVSVEAKKFEVTLPREVNKDGKHV